jgi:RNA polymerase sigma-70 factor (ECF subfamily)
MTDAHQELADDELLAAHCDGDPDAFGVLFGRHRDRLWAVALRTTGNPEDAADALQEAMISAFRRADSFRGDALVTTWLHRVVVNACLDRLRRNKVRAARPLPDDLEEYAAHGAVPGALLGADDHGDPEAQALLADRRHAVLAALDQLPPDQLAAVVLVDLEGYPVDEAARMLDCPPGTVKSRCSRGRSRLAGLLREAGLDGTTQTPATSHPQSPSTLPPPPPTIEPQGGARP